MSGQEYGQLTLFPADSHASLFRSPGSEEERMMTVTSGRKCLELYKRSGPAGLWGKMCLDLYETHLTKFLRVFSRRDTPQGHTLLRLRSVGRCSRESELLLWPRPTTGAPLCGGTHNFHQMQKLKDAGVITEEERRNLTQGNGGKSNPALMEWLMGFPIGWTELDA